VTPHWRPYELRSYGRFFLYCSSALHLRLPAIEPGVKAFVWALLLSLYVWGFMLAVGVDKGTSTVLGLVSFGAIFLCVRVFGESEEP
jgi:hypothetical protein